MKICVRFVEQAMPFKKDKGISWKLTVFRVLTYAEPGYVLLKQDKYAREENSDGIFHFMKYP